MLSVNVGDELCAMLGLLVGVLLGESVFLMSRGELGTGDALSSVALYLCNNKVESPKFLCESHTLKSKMSDNVEALIVKDLTFL